MDFWDQFKCSAGKKFSYQFLEKFNNVFNYFDNEEKNILNLKIHLISALLL